VYHKGLGIGYPCHGMGCRHILVRSKISFLLKFIEQPANIKTKVMKITSLSARRLI
jgi:hypothetical protein